MTPPPTVTVPVGPYSAEFGAISHEDQRGYLFTINPTDCAAAVAEALNVAHALSAAPQPAALSSLAGGEERKAIESAVRNASRGQWSDGLRVGSAKWCNGLTDAILAALSPEAPAEGAGEDFYAVGEFIGRQPVLCVHGSTDPNNLCPYCEGEKIWGGRNLRARSSAPEAREDYSSLIAARCVALPGKLIDCPVCLAVDNERARQAAPSADKLRELDELVSACEAEFCSPGTEGQSWTYGEDDDSEVAYPKSSITFGHIRRARQALAALQAEQKGGA
jgi:hypothetical protein